MNQKRFGKALKKAKKYVDLISIKAEIKNIVNKKTRSDVLLPRGYRNLIIAMEECGELIQEISKELRGKKDHLKLLQELADVQLSIYYIQEVCGISDEELNQAINVKMSNYCKEAKKKG